MHSGYSVFSVISRLIGAVPCGPATSPIIACRPHPTRRPFGALKACLCELSRAICSPLQPVTSIPNFPSHRTNLVIAQYDAHIVSNTLPGSPCGIHLVCAPRCLTTGTGICRTHRPATLLSRQGHRALRTTSERTYMLFYGASRRAGGPVSVLRMLI